MIKSSLTVYITIYAGTDNDINILLMYIIIHWGYTNNFLVYANQKL